MVIMLFVDQAEDRHGLANSLPKSYQIGRYGQGSMTDKQKLDLVAWCRHRETMNTTLTKAEIVAAIKRFALSNAGRAVVDSVEDLDHELKMMKLDANWDNIYLDWRQWVRRTVADHNLHIRSSKKIRSLRQIEANALTHEAVEGEFDRIQARLRRRGVGAYDDAGHFSIHDPSRPWCADEKGFNDEAVAGLSRIHTLANVSPSTQHSKTIKHLSVLTFISADGSVAPPGVVVSGKSWHPDYKTIWPEAFISANEKGSMTSALWVQMVAETFIHHVRVVKKMEGRRLRESIFILISESLIFFSDRHSPAGS
jgi:hypothetical protein